LRKLTTLVLILLFLFSVFFLSPNDVYADSGDTDMCYDEYDRCRERALAGDYGVIKTTLMLTACDIALPACIVAHAL